MSFDLLIRLFASGGSQVKSELDGVGTSATGVADKFEKVRNASAGLAVAGAAGLMLADNLSDAFVEADRLSGQLTTLLEGRGLGGSVQQVKELANEIASLKGLDDDAVAAAIGQAIATGRTRGLVEYGIVIDKVGQDAIKAAGDISQQAQSQEVLNQVMRASAGAVETLRANTSAATQSLGEMGVRFGNIQEGVGEGAAKTHAAIYEGVISPIFDILEAYPALQEGAGVFLTIGSLAAAGGGSILGIVSQISMVALAFPAIGTAATASFATVKVAAATTIPFLLGVAKALAVPFAILVAGAAVGIAAYETLRSLNIGGFGDSHKSTAEIISDTRKTLLGDPEAETQAMMDKMASTMPNMPTASPVTDNPFAMSVAMDQAIDSSGTSSTRSGGIAPPREYVAQVQSQTTEPNGDVRVVFAPLLIKRSPLERAFA